MKLMIICSKRFYDKINDIKNILENKGIEVYLPNCYDNPEMEDSMKRLGVREHQKFKAMMYKQSENTINSVDAVLVLNFNKDNYKNYVGGATFLEMYDAFRLGKKIYMYNAIPDGILYDEINGFSPVVINGNLELIYNNDLVKKREKRYERFIM